MERLDGGLVLLQQHHGGVVAFTVVMVAESLSGLGPRIGIPIGVILAGVASYSLLGALGL